MTIPPLAILAIGIAIVLGMIILLRANAFIALITAAIVVSLMAPGDIPSKIARVADSFGSFAGKIGIVIALAAVIGSCMMASGAADRIVRAFLRLLGEKRASFALMGSGFVLAVPVFFDTVFYLLVPLARSLFRRTNSNYLLYILAIGAGGAITHTLVPPTPGPLVMAETLGIDLGTMILIGALVAFPAALAGLMVSSLLNRVMPVPMRSIGSEPEPDPIPDEQLPSLFLSLMPVLLPVLMISSNTILTTIADNERAAQLRAGDIDWTEFQLELLSESDETPGGRLLAALEKRKETKALDRLKDPTPLTAEGDKESADQKMVREALNRVLDYKQLYDVDAFDDVLVRPGQVDKQIAALESKESLDSSEKENLAQLQKMKTAYGLLLQDRDRMKKVQRERMNRLLLELAFPEAIKSHTWETEKRKAANISALFGDANLALFISTLVAIYLYWKQRKPTLLEIAKTVETSLMSGGVIILITAAGGAFGAMLSQAQIRQAIEELFASSEANGMFYLFLGFGIAALLKIAQGSSTTAMIVGSAMLAEFLRGAELSYNAVYIATAIGTGSLIVSWMNDSGFWIFAKMGGLTEAEALKSWTVVLIVLGIVGMAVTVALSQLLPLV